MQNRFRKTAIVSLILVYLVIIAGAVVRMTGSGMGCPDWPKCFGYYIPPTNASELEWKPNFEYKKGQVIILEETLRVAKKDFRTAADYNDTNWKLYTKHDYAIFNPFHTWTEFINRLLGAVAGLATLVLAILSLKFWKKEKQITILSWLVVFAMGFQAWLGATVVYSVLAPAKITIHMVMALAIVALLLYLIYRSREQTQTNQYNKAIFQLLTVALGVTLVQIILGTQVRQFVDEQIDDLGEHAKELWLHNPTLQFYIHRSFSVVVVFLNGYLAYSIVKKKLGYKKINWVLGLVVLEIITGVIMYYFHFPFASQPLHLVVAAFLFGAQFYLILEATKSVQSPKTL